MAGLLISCDLGSDPAENARPGVENEPASAYTRRMLFVGGRAADPRIVVFDHGVLASPSATERSAGIWLAAGDEGWHPLVDLSWTDQPIREPWRPIPHGPLRIMVDDAGEVEALRGRSGLGTFRLAAMSRIGKWTPDDSPHFTIMTAEWSLEADSVAGVLVDILPETSGLPIPPATPSATQAGQPSALADADTAADVELVLTDGGEFRLVVSVPAALPGQLWIQRAERMEALDRVILARDSFPDEEGWRIDARGGELHGELRPLGATLELGRQGGEADQRARRPAAFQAMRGWIEIRGDRRNVVGIMRRAPA